MRYDAYKCDRCGEIEFIEEPSQHGPTKTQLVRVTESTARREVAMAVAEKTYHLCNRCTALLHRWIKDHVETVAS